MALFGGMGNVILVCLALEHYLAKKKKGCFFPQIFILGFERFIFSLQIGGVYGNIADHFQIHLIDPVGLGRWGAPALLERERWGAWWRAGCGRRTAHLFSGALTHLCGLRPLLGLPWGRGRAAGLGSGSCVSKTFYC